MIILIFIVIRRIFSQLNYFEQGAGPSEDYGYASTFLGPTGNRFVIIAGTRDVAVRQVAEEMTDAASIKDLSDRTSSAKAYEALFVVEAMKQLNMEARLVQVSPLNSDKIWNAPELQQFPVQ